jgi:hypothetical protein
MHGFILGFMQMLAALTADRKIIHRETIFNSELEVLRSCTFTVSIFKSSFHFFAAWGFGKTLGKGAKLVDEGMNT